MHMLLAALPFTGFYGSQHDAELDYAIEAMFSNDQGDPNPDLTDRVSGTCEWTAVHRAYAKEFAESFCEEVGIRHVKFDVDGFPEVLQLRDRPHIHRIAVGGGTADHARDID
jgi:hypothetical protein